MSHYRFIATERDHYPVQRLCQVLDVPASGFYAWQTEQQRMLRDPKTPTWETGVIQNYAALL